MTFNQFLYSSVAAAGAVLFSFNVYAAELDEVITDDDSGQIIDIDGESEDISQEDQSESFDFPSPSPDQGVIEGSDSGNLDDSGLSDFDIGLFSDLDDGSLDASDQGDSLDNEDISPYASYNSYYGSIGTTYLEFMRGYLPKLSFNEHYVASRVSQYDYIFAFGENLSYSGSSFVGSNVMVITWNTYNNGSFSYGLQSSFSLYPGTYLVYSDLTDFYPSLTDTSGVTLRQILILLTTVFLSFWMIHTYQVRKIRRIGYR